MKRKVFQPKKHTSNMVETFNRLIFRPGSVITDKHGRKYQIQRNGEWRRFKEDKPQE